MIAAALIGLFFGGWSIINALTTAPVSSVATYQLVNRSIVDTVIETGTLESQNKIDGICELHGWQNKITFLVEEGAAVKKGEVVVKFDASEIEEDISQQRITTSLAQGAVDEAKEEIEVQTNQNASDIAAAKLEKELADLDLEKYKEGDYKAELAELERSIAESKAALEQKTDELKNMRILVKKGYREPERLTQMEQAVKSAKFQVERDEQKKEVLEKFTYKRQITELKSKAEEAGRKLDRAEATAKAELSKIKLKLSNAEERLKIELEELKEEEEQLEKAVIFAPHDGTVAYANSRWMDQQFKIRPGGNVHRRQTVFHLPDMTRMQATLDVHESLINKLKAGQKAIVRVAPFPDHKFSGRIKKIADLARSDRNTEEKAYTAIVVIDSFPEEVKLKPGMSAETEIHVRTLQDVLAIPVQAVTQIAGKEYAYVQRNGQFDRVPVEVSEGNESFLIVESGLGENDVVAMDAYQRGLADIESEGLEDADSQSEFEDLVDEEQSDTETDKASESSEEKSDESNAELPVDATPEAAPLGLSSDEASEPQKD